MIAYVAIPIWPERVFCPKVAQMFTLEFWLEEGAQCPLPAVSYVFGYIPTRQPPPSPAIDTHALN